MTTAKRGQAVAGTSKAEPRKQAERPAPKPNNEVTVSDVLAGRYRG